MIKNKKFALISVSDKSNLEGIVKYLVENNMDFLEETLEDICQSGFKLVSGLNKQEVVVVPKKQTKQGFFEKLFHLFK